MCCRYRLITLPYRSNTKIHRSAIKQSAVPHTSTYFLFLCFCLLNFKFKFRISTNKTLVLSHLLARRKKESPVWDEFNEKTGKSKFLCKYQQSKQECCALMSGKNPTNLATYLSRMHKQEFEEFTKKSKLQAEYRTVNILKFGTDCCVGLKS